MPNLVNNYNGLPFTQIALQDALNTIKSSIEHAITTDGEKGKIALIRSQKLIKLIHDVVKTELLNAGIHPSLINPGIERLKLNKKLNDRKIANKLSSTLKDRELALCGYLKTKAQDISVVPRNILINPETLDFPTFLNGFKDAYGHDFTESVLSINVRSQLNSVSTPFFRQY